MMHFNYLNQCKKLIMLMAVGVIIGSSSSVFSKPARRMVEATPICVSSSFRFRPLPTPIPTTIDSSFWQLSMSSNAVMSAHVYTAGVGSAAYKWNARTNQIQDVRLNLTYQEFRANANNAVGQQAGRIIDEQGRHLPAVRNADGSVQSFDLSNFGDDARLDMSAGI